MNKILLYTFAVIKFITLFLAMCSQRVIFDVDGKAIPEIQHYGK